MSEGWEKWIDDNIGEGGYQAIQEAKRHERVEAYKEVIEMLEEELLIHRFGKANENIPDDKEDAYVLGYEDCLTDIYAIKNNILATLKKKCER